MDQQTLFMIQVSHFIYFYDYLQIPFAPPQKSSTAESISM